MRKLKIIQILPTLNTGGVERGVLDFNKYLVDKGHESYVISNGGRQVKNIIKDKTFIDETFKSVIREFIKELKGIKSNLQTGTEARRNLYIALKARSKKILSKEKY